MNRVTVLFCVYLHNPSLPWPSYTSQSLHSPPPPHLTWFVSVLHSTPLSLVFFILSACYINDTSVTEGKSSWTHLHHHRINLIMTLDTQFVRIISSLYHILCHFYAHPLVIPSPHHPDPTLGPEILCWYFAGMGGSRGLGLALGLRSRGFTLLFL